ncbi:TonB-dependent receptor [Seonamhaeicola sp.]|uniref:SusC/RagA family TonB-linked outer membrane protein n=1 Tax=Seonamhaeicola sp. TaxID=1912245 RepID=UPI0026144B44|nr:TonB-dependent receptor [Seonamhaeicola sp.]
MKIKLLKGCSFVRKRLPLLMMKAFIFFFCTAAFSFSTSESFAQKKIQIENTSEITVYEVFKIIKKQTDYRFLYPRKLFKDFPKVKLEKGEITLDELLEKSFRNGNVSFKLIGSNNIIVKKKERILVDKPQQFQVSGVVTDQNNQPLPGANIIEKGTTNGSQTDFDGKFTLSVSNENAVIVVSYIGFLTKEVEVDGQSNINIALVEDAAKLDEVVVVGYGTQKKSDLTGAVSSVKGSDLALNTPVDAANALQGRMTGVRVEADGSAPGAEPIITIRGSGTLSDVGPLYVIDGMLTSSMSFLNPQDIESVTVLKDASALAIYGSRAANGVVIVTTKKGKSGAIRVNIDSYAGFQEVISTIDYANAAQYANIRNIANDNDGEARSPANDSAFDPNVDSDMQAEQLRTAFVQAHSVSLSGGGDNLTFNLSGGVVDQEGIVKNSSFTRHNFRINSAFKKNKFKIDQSLSLSKTDEELNNQFGVEWGHLPTLPIYDENGGFSNITDASIITGVGTIANELALASLIEDTRKREQVLANLAPSYEIIPGLVYKLNLGMEYNVENRFTFRPTYELNNTSPGTNEVADLSETSTISKNYLVENTLNYKFNVGKHNFDILGGATYQKIDTRILSIQASGFPSNSIRVAGAAENLLSSPSYQEIVGYESYLGRLNYNYGDKYFLTASVRRDGSSRFSSENQWGTFPSLAFAWNVTNEGFMKEVSFINNLKLRGGYGKIGSDNIGAYDTQSVLNIASETVIGETRVPGTSLSNGSNTELIWETTETKNFGADLGFLNNRINFSVDYFIKDSNDVLASLNVSNSTGFSNAVPFNAVSIQNKGFEFMLNYKKYAKDFSFSATGTLSTLKNEVVSLGEGITPIAGGEFTNNSIFGTLTQAGSEIGSYFGHQVVGIYQTDAEALADGRTDAQAGDFIFRDVDGNGVIDNDDRVVLGSYIPDFEYGLQLDFTYKNFDLNLFFNGVQGNEILNGKKFQGQIHYFGNYFANAAEVAWSPSNPNATAPRLTINDLANNRRMSSFYVEDGSYFRLKNLNIGYTFPDDLMSKIGINRLRLYASMENVFTITNYSGYYPEVGRSFRREPRLFNSGVDERAYPAARTFRLGVQIGL